MTPETLRMAMAALDVPVRIVASGSGVSAATIMRIRNGQGAARINTLHKLQDWMIAQGVLFRQENTTTWVGVDRHRQGDR